MTSAKIVGMTLKSSVGQPMTVEFRVQANDRITGSVINTLATFNANVTCPEIANRILHNTGVFRMNAQSGAALAGGDTFYPSEWELSVDRKMSGVYGIGGVFNTIDEPTNDGTPEVKLKLTLPRWTAQTHFTNWEANTPQKMDCTFTGGLLAGSTYRSLVLSLPNIKYATVDAPEERGIVPLNMEYNAFGCLTAPSGMTGITKPFRAVLTNDYGGDPLQIGN